MSCKASVSVEVCGSSVSGSAEVSRVAGEGPASIEGSRAAAPVGSVSSIALGRSVSGNAGCRGSCESPTREAVSSEEFDSLDSDDLDESTPSLR